MEVTSEYVIEYLKGIDIRIEAKDDEDVLTIANYGLTNLATQILCFSSSEQINLGDYVDIKEITFSMANNIIDYYDAYVISTETGERQVTGFSITYTNDKRVTIVCDAPELNGLFSFVAKYFYYPVLSEGNPIIVEPEIWHYMKHSMQIVMWGGLKDYEKEQYHTKVLDDHLSQKQLSMPKDYANDSLRGFI